LLLRPEIYGSIAQRQTELNGLLYVLDRLPLAKTEDRPDRQAERADQVRFDSPDSQTIYDLIVQGESDGDRLLSKSGLSTSRFSLALTMLELNGYIIALGNNTWGKR